MPERDGTHRIFFLCEVNSSDSPSEPLFAEITRRLVVPAIPDGMKYELSDMEFRGNNEATLDHYSVDMMAEVDLVIADLSDLSATGYFVLGGRAYRGLPIVYIREQDALRRYDFDESLPVIVYSQDDYEAAIPDLREAIERAFAEKNNLGDAPAHQAPPRAMRQELADRITATAEAIRSLRINSVGESVEQLIAIAEELKNAPDEKTPSHLRAAADKALQIIFALMDELASQPGARMAITGAISLIVGGSGVSGAGAFSAGLAFWYGKDVFTKWINAWGKRKAPSSRTRKP